MNVRGVLKRIEKIEDKISPKPREPYGFCCGWEGREEASSVMVASRFSAVKNDPAQMRKKLR